VGIERPDLHDPSLVQTMVNPKADEKVKAGDRIVVIAERMPDC
jgi:Trk K+ transport system NAD-binding subunit